MERFSFSGLRARLTLLILLAMLPMLGLTVSTYFEERDLILTQIRDEVQLLSHFASGSQERFIETTRQLLVALSKIYQMGDRDSDRCSRLFGQVLLESPRYANVGIILPDGSPFCSAAPIDRPQNFSDRSWFRANLESRDVSMNMSWAVEDAENPTLNFSYPLKDDSGRLQAVVFAALDLYQLNQMALENQLPGMAELLLVSSNGTVLTYFPNPEKIRGKTATDSPIVGAILKEGKGFMEAPGLDGAMRLYVFTPLSSTVETGLYVSIGIPTALAYSEANRLLSYHFIGLGLITLLALAIVWIGSNTLLIRPVHMLVSAARRLSGGDMKARTGLPEGKGELNRLARAFDEMADALEVRAGQLRDAETRYRTLVEQLPEITYIARPDEVRSTLYISPQVQQILGFTPDEWMADHHLWLRQIHGEDVEQVSSALMSCHLENKALCCEYRISSRSGAVLWLHDEARTVRDGKGALYLQGVMRDITDQRLAEEKLMDYQRELRSLASQLSLAEERERRRIASDLHDQVGQTLAIARIRLGLLNEAAAASDHAESIEEIKRLIMQAIHDTRSLIYKISSPILYDLGLEAAVEWLAEKTQTDHGIEVQFETDGQPKPLDDDMKTFLFRAVGEILTNVVKHSRAKRVKVTVSRDDANIRICVRDDGIGFAEPPAEARRTWTGGFGLFSIRERMKHVEGSVEIDSQPGKGTGITLIASLKPASDANAGPT